MAKNKKDELQYLQAVLPPSAAKSSTVIKLDWCGLNYRQTKDTGKFSAEMNIQSTEAPYLTPCEKPEKVCDIEEAGGFGSNVIPAEIYGETDNLTYMGYFLPKTNEGKVDKEDKYVAYMLHLNELGSNTGYKNELVSLKAATYEGDTPPTGGGIVRFDAIKTSLDITQADANAIKRYLYFPYKVSQEIAEVVVIRDADLYLYRNQSFDTNNSYAEYAGKLLYFKQLAEHEEIGGVAVQSINFSGYNTTVSYPWVMPYYDDDGALQYEEYKEPLLFEAPKKIDGAPSLHHVCMAQQRLFGVDDGRVMASGYNDYANWNFDTAEEYYAKNAWMATLQSRNNNAGKITGIVTYKGAVYAFREGATFAISNTKNPFRITEIFEVGAISQKAIQVCGGYLIFAGRDGIYRYDTDDLDNIGYELGLDAITNAITGSDGRYFYMFCDTDKSKGRFFVYDTYTATWSERSGIKSDEEGKTTIPVCFAHNNNGTYVLSADNVLYKLDSGNYNADWYAETDLMTQNTIDIKHIRRVRIYADLAPESALKAYILYDNEEFFENSQLISEACNTSQKEIRVTLRVIPRKTAHWGFKIRLEGHGFVRIYQMELEISGGGDKVIGG